MKSNMNHFIYENKLSEIDNNFFSSLLNECSIEQYKKGDYLLQEGDTGKYSFYVIKGLLRYYTIDKKGKEHILQFSPENTLVSDRESAYFDLPSLGYIQALETTEVYKIQETKILEMAQADPEFLAFNNRLLHNHIRHLQKRINSLLGATAEDRYLDFVKSYPNILHRVPQTMVASYLGITPESLSRVRKELVQTHS